VDDGCIDIGTNVRMDDYEASCKDEELTQLASYYELQRQEVQFGFKPITCQTRNMSDQSQTETPLRQSHHLMIGKFDIIKTSSPKSPAMKEAPRDSPKEIVKAKKEAIAQMPEIRSKFIPKIRFKHNSITQNDKMIDAKLANLSRPFPVPLIQNAFPKPRNNIHAI